MSEIDAVRLESEVYPVVKIHAFGEIKNGGTPSSDEANWDGDIPFITPPDLNGLDSKSVASVGRTITELGLKQGSNLVENGVIISGRAPVGYVGVVVTPAAFNQGCKAICTAQNHRYVAYALTASKSNLQVLANGTTFPEISSTALANYAIPLPPLETQRHIADYLDRETTEIDAAVADLDRYVELLEKRLELSVAKMLEKDQHPSVPLFTMCDFSSGEGIPRDELHESGEYPVYGGNGIMGYSKQYNQSVDSIVVGRVGALCGNVHLAKAPFFVTDNAMVVSLKEAVSLDWLVFALRDLRLRELSQSSAQPVITSTKVSRQRVSRPSFSRQSQIADSILNEASEVNALIADSINLRDLLIRRRSVLISDVVTGRKQV